MSSRGLKPLLALFAGALVLYAALYFETLASLVQKWSDDSTFNHGFLVLPISLWLAWRQRRELAGVYRAPSITGSILLLGGSIAWLVAKGTGVQVLEHLATVAILAALVPAIFGWRVAQALAFPLFFLIFAVPFGRGLEPLLMGFTADFATLALSWSGVPVLRSHMFISIPGGDFEVARACAGLGYLISGLMLGMLYAKVSFSGWRKRLLCVAAFTVVPVLANGVRVYLTILVSHLTDMQYGPGQEHVTFGRIFFLVTVFAMFLIGSRWHDHPAVGAGRVPGTGHAPGFSARAWPAFLALLFLLPGPLAFSATIQHLQHASKQAERWRLPAAGSGWQGPLVGAQVWRPQYHGGLTELLGSYRDAEGGSVETFVGVYGLGATAGQEMISYDHVLTAADLKSLALERRREVVLAGGRKLAVQELQLVADGRRLLVWYWFMVGGRTTTSPFQVKALEAVSFMLQRPDLERIVTLATVADSGADKRLESFLATHADCLLGPVEASSCVSR